MTEEDPDLLAGEALDILRGRNTADEIERLRKERENILAELDAARREACRGEAMLRLQRHRVHRESEEVVRMAKEIAVERGWDCFKESNDE